MSDDFSDPTLWTAIGSGDVFVSGGECVFDAVFNGAYNKVLRPVGAVLSDTYWKTECDFSITSPNPQGNGTGEIVLALTAGNLDFISYDQSMSYTETNQDGIGVIIYSNSATDNNINNWYFVIEGKQGNVRTVSTSQIFCNAAISDYYLSLERTAPGMTRLSIYTDQARTTHLAGSPITFSINASITGLTTIQHGTSTPGTASRLIHATIDNDLICDDKAVVAGCDSPTLTDDFSNNLLWTAQGNGDVNVSNGKCNFDQVYNGAYNRVYRSIGSTLSDAYWKTDCDFTIVSPNPQGNGTGEVVLALTAGTLDFISYDASSSYQETNQDGIAVIVFSDSPTDADIDNWYFVIEGKRGNVRSVSTSRIYCNSTISNYYLSLERTSAGGTELAIYSDQARTTHISGSPITFSVNNQITGLNVIQHGTSTPGTATRLIDAEIDNDVICEGEPTGVGPGTQPLSSANWVLFPNPAASFLKLENVEGAMQGMGSYEIVNTLGQSQATGNWNAAQTIPVVGLPPGAYFLIVNFENGDRAKLKFLKQAE